MCDAECLMRGNQHNVCLVYVSVQSCRKNALLHGGTLNMSDVIMCVCMSVMQ